MSIMYRLGLSSLIFAYFTLQIMVRLSIVVSEKITKVDFPSWLVAGWSISFSALIVLIHYRSPIFNFLIRKIDLSS